jgi:4'-phosphopantetheinyl transferase EntD
MSWRDIPPLDTDLAGRLCGVDDVALVAVRVDAVDDALFDDERAAVAGAVGKRVREFGAGRFAARCALGDLGLEPCSIPRADDRRPCWPSGVVGSISHGGDVAVAGLASSRRFAGLGVDLEVAGRVTGPLHARLFTATERSRYERRPGDWATLLFSAKEAVYKAVNPLTGRYIGFQEVEVDVDWADATFRARYVGDHPPNAVMHHGAGRFAVAPGYVFTLFSLRADDLPV